MASAYIHTNEFNKALGSFHYNWTALDLRIDYAIWQFFKITEVQAHIITSSMMFGRKIRLLVDLIKHSDDPKKNDYLSILGQLGKAKREILTHSYIRSDANSVTFLERKISESFSAKEHTYSREEFEKHLRDVYNNCLDFDKVLGASSAALENFAKTALSVSRSK